MVERTPRPPPIRVRVDQRFPTDEERARAALETDPTETLYDTIPDGQRVAVLLQWIHEKVGVVSQEGAAVVDALARLEGHVLGLSRQTEGVRIAAETLDKRIGAALRELEERRAAEVDALVARPRWRAVLEHPTTRPALGLLTWLGGMASMGLLDYLGLESEPIFRLIALIWGL